MLMGRSVDRRSLTGSFPRRRFLRSSAGLTVITMPNDFPEPERPNSSDRTSPVIRATTHSHPTLHFTHPLPYGAILHDDGVQFAVFSRSATAMRLLLYHSVDSREPDEVISFHPDSDRWGDIWSIFVPNIGPGQLYHFQADGPFDPEQGQRFDGRARLDRSLRQSPRRPFPIQR